LLYMLMLTGMQEHVCLQSKVVTFQQFSKSN
jgi:hypothetical protein